MGQALYRKYRSRSFDEVIGQEHITTTLKNAIKSGRINHAYLFTGPKGVGKTSVARILAHAVNELPYSDESIHLDIIEIDGASNRRIDEIRELRDKVNISPTSAHYKVYIIDEVHMLTREAFNALLKTLEEPPVHCIFILATTEAHKLPATIISRTQRFEFKPIPAAAAAEHLATIAKKEKIDVEPAALELLAAHGQGSFRDSIGLLDQLASPGVKVTEAYVRQFLGLPPAELIEQLAEAIAGGHSQSVLTSLDQLKEQGSSAAINAKLLAGNLRQKLVEGEGADWIPALLKALLEVPASSQSEEVFEISVLEAGLTRRPENAETFETTAQAEIDEPEYESTAEPAPAEPRTRTFAKGQKLNLDDAAWNQILERSKKQAASVYTALRLATPKIDNDVLVLSFRFPLHQKKVNQAKNKDLITKIVSEVTGQNLAVKVVVGDNVKPAAQPAKSNDSSIKNISNIFGQPEVLES